MGAPALGQDHPVRLEEPDVVDKDLPQAFPRVHDVHRASPILLGHGGALGQPRVRLLSNGREHLEMMVDAAKLVGDLDEPELGEVPHVGRELAGDAWALPPVLHVLVEVLVHPIDEDGEGRGEGAQPRYEMPVGVGGAALELARGEVEQAHEMIDHAVQSVVVDEPGEARADPEIVHLARVLEGGHGDGSEPQLRPRQGGSGEEGEGLAAEDLVADGLVEQIAGGQAARPAVALVQDALGLEEQRLAEALGGDDDELVIPIRGEEAVDLGRPVEERLVEVVRHPDVIGVNRPGSHVSLEM